MRLLSFILLTFFSAAPLYSQGINKIFGKWYYIPNDTSFSKEGIRQNYNNATTYYFFNKNGTFLADYIDYKENGTFSYQKKDSILVMQTKNEISKYKLITLDLKKMILIDNSTNSLMYFIRK